MPEGPTSRTLPPLLLLVALLGLLLASACGTKWLTREEVDTRSQEFIKLPFLGKQGFWR